MNLFLFFLGCFVIPFVYWTGKRNGFEKACVGWRDGENRGKAAHEKTIAELKGLEDVIRGKSGWLSTMPAGKVVNVGSNYP